MTCIYTGARVLVDGAKYACDVHWVPRSSVFVLRVNRLPFSDQNVEVGVTLKRYMEFHSDDVFRTLIVERESVILTKEAVLHMSFGADDKLYSVLTGSE